MQSPATSEPTGADATLRAWLAARRDRWTRLARWVASRDQRGAESIDDVMGAVTDYTGLAGDTALAQAVLPRQSELLVHLQALMARAAGQLMREPASPGVATLRLLTIRVAAAVAGMKPQIVFAVAFFLGSAACGAGLVMRFPELAALFASERMIEEVQGGRLWTDDLLNVVPSSLLSIGIFTNNIAVTLFTFALGALYGLGTMYILGTNGLMLGGVFAFTWRHDMADELFSFIVAHGPVELSIVCVAGAAGMLIGEALARPGLRSRSAAFNDAATRAGTVMALCVPFLVGAGLIEGFVSPDDAYSLQSRVTIGVCYEILFLIALTGGQRLYTRRR
ncbi:MAG: stage II sporulation protein M [Gammaproteobacteria bacterium]